MTLNLTIVNRYGAWQCSDHRLTDLASGNCIDDTNVKHVILRCPDGSALIAFAGLGRIEGVAISDWLHEILRGKCRTVEESLITMLNSATQDLAPRLSALKLRHMFTIAAFIKTHPWIIQIRNFSCNRSGIYQATDKFLIAREVSEVGCTTIFGEGVSAKDTEKLKEVCVKKPRNPKEFAKLLGGVNGRAAMSNNSISPQCVVTYMPPEGLPCETRFFDGNQERINLAPTVPVILFGVDLTDAVRMQVQALLNLKNDISDPEMQHKIERLAEQAALPKDRLKLK